MTISATLTFSGCDYLDDMPYDWAQPDDIFTNEQNYLKPINQVYAYIPEGFNHVGNAFLDAFFPRLHQPVFQRCQADQ